MEKLTWNINLESGEIFDEKLDEWIMPSPEFGSQILDHFPTLIFAIEYPLTNRKMVNLSHEDGSPWTQKQFIQAVIDAYHQVYKEEGSDPGRIPGMLNRKRSFGPYGIWGHDLRDLILEGAHQRPDGCWGLEVGS